MSTKRPKVNFQPEAWVNISELKEHPKNPRVDIIDLPEKFDALKKSILEGVFEPIKISKKSGYCLAGNQRLKAFKELGFDEVPVMYNDCKDEKEEITIIIKDNNEWGQYDYDELNALIEDMELSIEELGFDDEDLSYLQEKPDVKMKNVEFNASDLEDELKNKCPKCGFKFDKHV